MSTVAEDILCFRKVFTQQRLLHLSCGRPCQFSRMSLVSVPTSHEQHSSCPVFADTGCGLFHHRQPGGRVEDLTVVLICIPWHLMTLSIFSYYC